MKRFMLSFLIAFIFLNVRASEFLPEDLDPDSPIDLTKTALEEMENLNSPEKLLCLKRDRDWEKLGDELNFLSVDGDCQGLLPKEVRQKIKEAYKGDDWREATKRMYQELKENREYHRYHNCKSIKRNIHRDNNDCSPSLKEVRDHQFSNIKGCKQITGKMGYVGMIYLPYRYKICPNEFGKHDLVVNVYIKREIKSNKKEDPLQKYIYDINRSFPIEDKLEKAQNIWNSQNPLKSKIRFKFKLVQTPEDADFKIDLTNSKSRGPYCKKWSNTWNSNTIAHEIGHMLGLDDEYNQVIGSTLPMYHITYHESYCNPESIMCDEGQPKPYHYYMIFRRLLCQ